jgi:hypothetical protein
MRGVTRNDDPVDAQEFGNAIDIARSLEAR